MPKRRWREIDWTGLVCDKDGNASASKLIFLVLGFTACTVILITAVRVAFGWEEILAVISGTTPGVAAKWVSSKKAVEIARVDAGKIRAEAG